MSIIVDMNVIKELRTESGLTQQQLAKEIGTNTKSIVRWENEQSEITVYYLIKLAKYFHVSTDYLLGLIDDSGQKPYVDITDSITPDEQKIITEWRKLSPSNREMLLRMLNIQK